ncbi:MAG: molybdenum cofactor guanylyltransferase MobA [Paracoccus sp. (in: a-proteobacteria)]|nr:molybdenum cofactor guanylyltransferase MobA [Paracoccus sp. (in: a-proteobacteria)]
MTNPPAVILAGGLATRMGGGDKCLLRVGDRTLLSRIIARLRPQAGPLALNANGDPARFAAYTLPVLPDGIEGYAGPLAGILAGMDWAAELGASHILSVAGDTPFFPADLAARLRASGDFALAASHDEEGILRRHPTFGLWPVALRDDLRAALQDGLRKIVLWTDCHGAVTVPFPQGAQGHDPFFNINTPEDIARAGAML